MIPARVEARRPMRCKGLRLIPIMLSKQVCRRREKRITKRARMERKREREKERTRKGGGRGEQEERRRKKWKKGGGMYKYL